MLLQDGRNLLCWAAANGFLPIVMHLLDMGAALEATDKVNTNLLTRSLPVPPNLQIFESPFVLAVYQQGNTALLWASHNGHLPVIQILLERGANFSVESKVS
jgi:ankyrin repeat protein